MKTKILLLTLASIFIGKLSLGQTSLNYFQGNQSGFSIDLNWQSASQVNLEYFTIERSLDNLNFSPIQIIVANGTSVGPVTYYYTDISPFVDTCYFYRLKATDFSGINQYFDTVSVCYSSAMTFLDEISTTSFVSIYPNPFSSSTTIHSNHDYSNARVILYTIDGKVVNILDHINGRSVKLDRGNLPDGTYVLRIQGGNNIVATEKLVIME